MIWSAYLFWMCLRKAYTATSSTNKADKGVEILLGMYFTFIHVDECYCYCYCLPRAARLLLVHAVPIEALAIVMVAIIRIVGFFRLVVDENTPAHTHTHT
jgi:hypothetical protein